MTQRIHVVTRPTSACTVALAVALVGALIASRAGRAEGEPEGQDPYYDANGHFVGGLDTNGFVLQNADGSWSQVCTGSFQSGGFQADFSKVLSDGTLLVGGIPGIGLSTDHGCSFTMVPDLAGHHTSSLAVANGTLYTATEDNNAANGIWQSIDGGQQWTLARQPEDGLLIFELVASKDGQKLAASGLRISGPNVGVAVLVSTDGGISFQDVSAGYAGLTRVRAVTFDADDAGLLLGGFGDPNDADSTNPGFVFLDTSPYGAPAKLGHFPSEVRDIAIFNGKRYALAYNAKLSYVMAAGDAGFTQIWDKDSGPASCLFAKPDGTGLVGCGIQGQRTPVSPMFLESSDGQTWQVIMNFPDVSYRSCPAGSAGASACARFDEASQCGDGIDNDFDGKVDCDDPDCFGTAACPGTHAGEGEGEGASSGGEGEGSHPPGTTTPSTCACSGASAAVTWGALGFVVLALRRRRRR